MSTRSRRQRRRWWGPLAVLALGVAACGDGGSASGGPAGEGTPVVVATTGIWADVVANVACGGVADVRSVVPPGADPHAFEPSLADRGELEAAALVVANGLGLEEGLADTLDAVAGAGTSVLLVGEHVDPLPYASVAARLDGTEGDHDDDGADHDHADDGAEGDHDDDGADHGAGHDADGAEGDHAGAGADDGHDHGGTDPHVWFDPMRVSEVLDVVADRLVADAGLDADAIAACVTDYRDELAAVDAEVAEVLAEVPPERRLLLTNHDSLGYLADRYGFEVVGTVIPTPSGLAETNPAQLAALAELIGSSGVRTVFAEEQHSTDDAEALAERVGDVAVVTLLTGSLGQPGSGADTYLGLLRHDARLIAEALG